MPVHACIAFCYMCHNWRTSINFDPNDKPSAASLLETCVSSLTSISLSHTKSLHCLYLATVVSVYYNVYVLTSTSWQLVLLPPPLFALNLTIATLYILIFLNFELAPRCCTSILLYNCASAICIDQWVASIDGLWHFLPLDICILCDTDCIFGFWQMNFLFFCPVWAQSWKNRPASFPCRCERQVNQALSVLYLSLGSLECVCCAVNYGHFLHCVSLCYLCVVLCSVSWLFLLGCQYQCNFASDWLERLVSKMTHNMLMGTYWFSGFGPMLAFVLAIYPHLLHTVTRDWHIWWHICW